MAEYHELLARQGGACAVCHDKNNSETTMRRGKRGLHVDHDHKTGQVRGLLCNGCNRALGFTGDRPEVLRAAADYLERCANMVVDRQAEG